MFSCLIVRPCTGAIQSLTFALYLTKPFFPECDPPDDALRLIAAVCLSFLCFINCYSVKWATLVQDYFTYAKVFALMIIIGTGLYMLGNGQTANFNWQGTETDITVIGNDHQVLHSYCFPGVLEPWGQGGVATAPPTHTHTHFF